MAYGIKDTTMTDNFYGFAHYAPGYLYNGIWNNDDHIHSERTREYADYTIHHIHWHYSSNPFEKPRNPIWRLVTSPKNVIYGEIL